MNTEIRYKYVDAHGYKAHGSVIIGGVFTEDRLDEIRAKLVDGEMFIPGQVGLKDLQTSMGDWNGWDDDADHPYHMIEEFMEIDDMPTIIMTVDDLHKAFMEVASWDDTYLPSDVRDTPYGR